MAVVFGKGSFQPEPKKTGTRQRTGKNPRVAEGFLVQTGREQAQVGDQETDVFETKTRTVRLPKKVDPKDASPGGRKRLARYVVYTYTSDGRVSKEFRSTPDGEPIDIKGEKKIVSATVADQQIKQYEQGGAKVKTTRGDAAKKGSNEAKLQRDRDAKKPKRKKPTTTKATVGEPVRDNKGNLSFDETNPRSVTLPGDELAIRSDDLETSDEKRKRKSRSRTRPESDRAKRGRREKPKTIGYVTPGQTLPVDEYTKYNTVRALPSTSITSDLGVRRTNRGLMSPNRKRDPLGRNIKKLRAAAKENHVLRVAQRQMELEKELAVAEKQLRDERKSPGTYSKGKGKFDETAQDRRRRDAELMESDSNRREGRGGSGVRGAIANSTEGQKLGTDRERELQQRVAKLRAEKEALSRIEDIQAGDFSKTRPEESLDALMKEAGLDSDSDIAFDDDDLQRPRSRGGGPAARTGLPPALSSGSLSDPARAASEYVFADERNEDLMNRGGETATNRRLMARRAESARPGPTPERIPGQGNPLEVLGPPRQRAGTAKADQEAILLTRMLKELKEGRGRREDLIRLGMGGLARQEARSRGNQNMVRELFRMLSGSVADTGVDRDEALKILSKIIRGGRG